MENIKNEGIIEGEVVQSDGTETDFVLSRPIIFDGETIEKIKLDFDSLTGGDIEKAELQFNSENPQGATVVIMKEMSKGFCAIVAAKAAKVNVNLIRSLNARDYTKITARVMNFLLGGK